MRVSGLYALGPRQLAAEFADEQDPVQRADFIEA